MATHPALDTLLAQLAPYLGDPFSLPIAIIFVSTEDPLALGSPHQIPHIYEATAA
jgi:hypothetical protein